MALAHNMAMEDIEGRYLCCVDVDQDEDGARTGQDTGDHPAGGCK